MKIRQFEWDHRNIAHVTAHSVEPEEAEEVIAAINQPTRFQKVRQRRYLALGVSEHGRYLAVIFKDKGGGLIRPITAYPMSSRAKKRYRRWLKRRG